MTTRMRKARSLEARFLQFYSAWQENHQMELADRWMTLVGEIIKLNPSYSIRRPFQRAF